MVTVSPAVGVRADTVPAPLRARVEPGYDVTLITGDKVHVTVDPDGKQRASVTTRQGEQASAGFRMVERGGEISVLPSDVEALIPEKLDPALFNVTALAGQGYTDQQTGSLPLIVQYGKGAAPLAGLTTAGRLESIGASAVTLAKKDAATFAAGLVTPKGLAAGVSKIWLDRRITSRRSEDAPATGQATAPTSRETAPTGQETALTGQETALTGQETALTGQETAPTGLETAQTGQEAAPEGGQVATPTSPEQAQGGQEAPSGGAGDGTGTTVAVLDGGIDATHPDLAGKVVATRDFTPEGDGVDRTGSGTAIAGVIAGSGAASGGAYKGVSPGARLLNGKILDADGNGLVSWAIRAMEWASGEAHADVVTMTASVADQGGPMTDAVNELSATNGTLFVISAGNHGCEACVTSPADSPAALTVGALDDQGAPAAFSGYGPVGLHRAVKPEISALGVGVVSTRAGGTRAGEPVDDHYGRYSSTGLAMAYVAGTAALVRQARPGITGAELRSALVGGSAALPDVPVDRAGAGRADVRGALASTVLAGDAALDFGLSTAGSGASVTRTVTYRNPAAEPVTLALAAGAPFTLSATELTLPAGGKGQVDVTLDPARTPAGWVRAELTATSAGGGALRTLLTGNVEVQRVKLQVSAIARDGRPASILPSVVNVENGELYGRELPHDPDRYCEEGSWSCWLVAPGTYSVLGVVTTLRPEFDGTWGGRGDVVNLSFVGNPQMEVAKDTEVVLDARKAVAVRIETPDHVTRRNRGAAVKIVYTRQPEDGPRYSETEVYPGRTEESFYLQPTAKATKGEFAVATRWRLEAPVITMRAPGIELDPKYPDPVFFSNRSTQFPRLDGTASLTVVDAGDGGADALKGRDLRGELALIHRPAGVPVSTLANAAGAAGARMVAIYGDPYVDWHETQLTVPTVMLTEQEGARLAERVRDRPVKVAAKGVVASPYVYDLYLIEKGQVRKHPTYMARTRSLARVDTAFHTQLADDVAMSETRYGWLPWETSSLDISRPMPKAPRERTDYVSPGPEVEWSAAADVPERSYNAIIPEEEQGIMSVAGARRGYRAGERVTRSYFKQPVAPGFPVDSPTTRQGDVLSVEMRAFVDGQGNVGSTATDLFEHGFTSDWRIYRGDELIAGTALGGSGRVLLPPERAGYRIEYAVENHSTWARLSTRTRTVWTFDSEHVDGDPLVLPLLAVSYDAPVDLRNRASSTRLGLTVAHQPGAEQSAIKEVTLETSSDDGRTWRPARRLRHKGQGAYEATIERPSSGLVSLRVTASDTAGATVTQEVIRAYAMR
ncbi:S8 family serine peptidase [Nonomuraea phyllanthi]|nr:S8 family serine peptidase [Nonomuraea phyllanthi]